MEKVIKINGKKTNYSINESGEVRNLTTNQLKKPSLNTSGYPYVALTVNGSRKNEMVHRLVAKAFIPNPKKNSISIIKTVTVLIS